VCSSDLPGQLHGGITTAILDETIARSALPGHPDDMWWVSVEVSVRFRKPVPLGQELRVLGRITKDTRRFFEGSGEILLPDGQVAAEATGRYLRLPLDRAAGFDEDEQEWRVTESPSDPLEVEIPERETGESGGRA
jgi:hypothetical protein